MTESEKEILISAYVLAKLLSVDALDPTTESAGLLLGYLDDDGQTLVITDFDTGRQRQTSTYVVLDDEALVQIVEDLQKRNRKETIVGWAHTHPSFGCFLSGTDKGTQRTYQNLFPQAVALVVDPAKYYISSEQKDLEIKFFRLIDDVDYKAISFGIFFDDVTKHVSNLIEMDIKWKLPQLSQEETEKLHKKLKTIISPNLAEEDKQLLHGFLEILTESKEEFVESGQSKKMLESIDHKLGSISDSINFIYNEETTNFYAIMNVVAVIIIALAWILIALLT